MQRFVGLILAFLGVGILALKGCGKKEKLVIQEEPAPEEITCEGIPVGKLRNIICEAGYEGTILQVCQKEGWSEISRNCTKKPTECESEAGDKVTFQKDILPITKVSCAVSGCHTAEGYSFLEYNAVKQRMLNYQILDRLNRTDSARMPPIPKAPLSPDEIEKFRQWERDGLPNGDECADKDAFGNGFRYIDREYEETVALKSLFEVDNSSAQRRTFFLSLGYLYNLRPSKEEWDQYQAALSKGLNYISIKDYLSVAYPVDARRVIWRIDLEDYGLDRIVEYNPVSGQDPYVFSIAVPKAKPDPKDRIKGHILQMILNKMAFVVKSETDEGKQITALTGRDVNIVDADDFLFTALFGQIYYDILGIGPNKADIYKQCGIDIVEAHNEFEVRYMATDTSPLGRFNRLVTFTENGPSELCKERGLWTESWDVLNVDVANKNILEAPFTNGIKGVARKRIFDEDGQENFFEKDNGTWVGFLNDGNGNLVECAPAELVHDYATVFNDPIICAMRSCLSCHSGGLIPFLDQFKQALLQPGNGLNRDEKGLVEDLFGSPVENANHFATVNNRFSKAHKNIGVDIGKPDPVTELFKPLRFNWGIHQFCARVRLPLDECKNEIARSDAVNAQIGRILFENNTIKLDQIAKSFQDVVVDEFRLGQEPRAKGND